MSELGDESLMTDYFLGDALGSVRQLTDSNGNLTLSKAYDPYGEVTQSAGAGQSSYGYTNEYQDGYNQLVYLRARHYAPSMGRFLSRDTWAGDTKMPMSYNLWLYTYANPANLTDPSGMVPEPPLPPVDAVSVSIYCNGLQGNDRLYCERIVRGFNPDAQIPLAELIMGDFYGECYLKEHYPDLYKDLPHVVHKGTPIQNGWWYHYLLEHTPGWWNNHGKGHIYFGDVITFALGVELSSKGSDTTLVGYAAGSFATKGRNPDYGGFYGFIGSRQSVYERVNTTLYGDPKGGSYNFDISRFNPDSDRYHIQTRYGGPNNWGEKILRHSGFTEEQLLAWDWGNPLVGFEDVPSLDKLETALNASSFGTGVDQVLYRDRKFIENGKPPTKVNDKYYSLFFIVSQAQQINLCGNNTCVRNTP